MTSGRPATVARQVLGNGLRLLCQPDPDSATTVARLCLVAGARHDPPERSGLAHLCEHLLCQGLGDPETSGQRRVEEAGGESLGWTFHDRICFAETVPPEALEAALLAHAERLSPERGAPSADQLAREREVLVQERREREAIPLMQASEALHRLLYPDDHPYHRPPTGLVDSLSALAADDVSGFLSRHFVADRAVLVVAGAVDPEEVGRRVEELFALLPRGWDTPPAAPAVPPNSSVPARSVLPTRGTEPFCYLAFVAPGYGTREGRMAALLARGLATGRSSPLHRRLVEQARVASGVRAYVEPLQGATTVAFMVAGAPGAEPERLESALLEAVDALLAGELAGEALERARKMTLIEHYAGQQRLDVRTDRLACDEAFGVGEPDDLERQLSGIALSELLASGLRWFYGGPRAVISVVPASAGA